MNLNPPPTSGSTWTSQEGISTITNRKRSVSDIGPPLPRSELVSPLLAPPTPLQGHYHDHTNDGVTDCKRIRYEIIEGSLEGDLRRHGHGGDVFGATRPSQETSAGQNNFVTALPGHLEEYHLNAFMTTFEVLAETENDSIVRLQWMERLRNLFPLVLSACLGATRNESLSARRLIPSIIMAMRQHATSVVVQYEAARCLQHFFIGGVNGIDTRHHHRPNDESYLKQALPVLFQSIAIHKANAGLICLLFDLLRRIRHYHSVHSHWRQGIKVLVNVLGLHPTVIYLQQIGLCIVAWLAEDEVCRDGIIEANAMSLIPFIMQCYMEDSLIQCNAAATICWLVHAGGRRNGRCHLDPQYLPSLLEILGKYQDNKSVFGNCVCLLCGIHDPRVDSEDVVELVLNGMKRHTRSAKVQEGCLRWMRFRNPTTFESNFQSAIPILLDALRNHPADAHLQAQAAEVLTSLVSVESLRISLLQHSAVDLVLTMLKRHKDDCRVQQGAIWFLTLAMPTRPSTIAFGGGFNVLETIWQSLGIDDITVGGGTDNPMQSLVHRRESFHEVLVEEHSFDDDDDDDDDS